MDARIAIVAGYLVEMGVDASVCDTGGNIECVRVDAGNGDIWLFGTANDTWGGSIGFDAEDAENRTEEYIETNCSTDQTDLFKVAQAINLAINPDSGRR